MSRVPEPIMMAKSSASLKKRAPLSRSFSLGLSASDHCFIVIEFWSIIFEFYSEIKN